MDIVCYTCDGEGFVEGTCGRCAGSGEGAHPGASCWFCKGSGEDQYACAACDGSGVIDEDAGVIDDE